MVCNDWFKLYYRSLLWNLYIIISRIYLNEIQLIFNNGIFKNYKQQLIQQIVDFGNTTEYEILHNDNMESDSQSSNEDNFSSNDSCSDMDVENTEEHKEQSISKQEQIDRKIFSYYSHNDQNIIMFLKYIKQRNFYGPKEKPGLSLINTRYSENLDKTTEKLQSRSPKILRMSMSNMFSVKLIKTDHYQPKIFRR